MTTETYNNTNKQQNFWLPLLFFLIGGTTLCLWIAHRFVTLQTLSLSRQDVEHLTLQDKNNVPVPQHLFINHAVDVNIEALNLVDGKWAVSETQASYLNESAKPGEKGNIIIYGHNKRDILGGLRKVHEGDRIVVTTQDGKEHSYIIALITQVSPKDIHFLLPTREETLTMYTCTGFFDSKRLIIRALPASQ